MTADTRTPWGSTITVEVVTSLAGVEPPTWMDISDRVSFRELGQITVTNGRQSDLSGDEPAQLSIAFRDDDHLFTVGDILRAGRRIRVRESFGLSTFDLIDAEIQVPTTSTAMDLADGSQADITVSVTATDQLGRLRDARKFISTLTEYIIHQARPDLMYYWLLNDATTANGFVARNAPAGQYSTLLTGITGNADGAPVQAQAGASAPGDDLRTVNFSVTYAAALPVGSGFLSLPFASPITLATGDTITIAFWATPLAVDGDNPVSTVVLFGSGAPDNIAIGGMPPNLGGQWISDFSFNSAAWGSSPGVGGVAYNTGNLVTSQVTLGQAPLMWVNQYAGTATPLGVVPASISLPSLLVGIDYPGSVSHLQIYVSRAGSTPFSRADHLAQYVMGQYGLEGQLTGDRINTILDYAGVPSGRRDIDPGVAMMSMARLAGKDPLTCLEEARRTEQGRLFSSGDRRIQFRDRQRSYNA